MNKDKSKGAGSAGTAQAEDGLWHYEVPQQDSAAGAVQSNAGHYTGGAHGGDSQEGDFLSSPPDANAMPAGAPQTSRGSAGMPGADPQTGLAPGAAGGKGAGGAGEIASGDSIGGADTSGDAGAPGAGAGAGGGAGGGQPAPVGNGTKNEPIWGS
ncbi:hypothetical protein IM543_12445 [Massilia sp. UMI-21]|nr:hypothetical protein IM543_12445 [Massilia sp. UMI-21]